MPLVDSEFLSQSDGGGVIFVLGGCAGIPGLPRCARIWSALLYIQYIPRVSGSVRPTRRYISHRRNGVRNGSTASRRPKSEQVGLPNISASGSLSSDDIENHFYTKMKVSIICVWLIVFTIASASEPQGPDRGNATTDSSGNATGTEAPTTNKLKRDSGLFTDDDDGQPVNGPPQIESVYRLLFLLCASIASWQWNCRPNWGLLTFTTGTLVIMQRKQFDGQFGETSTRL